jgi:hypothetical protein
MDKADEWDYSKAERRQGNPDARAVVSVALSRAEFEAIAARARQQGKKISAYIREAALAHVEQPRNRIWIKQEDTYVNSPRAITFRLQETSK